MIWIQDPGHGGKDSGAFANGQMEKKWALEAGLYVNRRLNELGITSKITRSGDETITSQQRASMVRNSGALYCISHHFNAGGGKGAELIHSIYTDGGFERIIEEEFEVAGMETRRIFTRRDSSNNDYYFMHRDTGTVQTTIIEYGFLDSPDFDLLKEIKFRHQLYEAVVKAICRFHQVVYKVTQTERTKGLYHVQVGAFTSVELAKNLAIELQRKGYGALVRSE